jgi:hypothetical protein
MKQTPKRKEMDQRLTMYTIKIPFFLIHEKIKTTNNKNRIKNVPICSNVFLGAFILLRKKKKSLYREWIKFVKLMWLNIISHLGGMLLD